MTRLLAILCLYSVAALASNPAFIQECKDNGFYVNGSNANFENWKHWVSKQNVTDSVGLFKNLVKESEYSPFETHMVRMAYSRSAQAPATSPDHPRLITFHPMGLILGLVDPEDPALGFYKKSIEGVRYDYDENEWKPLTGKITEKGVEVSDVPSSSNRCTKCHGSPFLPIWRTYSAWAGQASDFGLGFEKDRFVNWLPGVYENAQVLNMFLNSFNFKRIHTRLKENPNWNELRTAAVAAILGCEDIPSMIKPEMRKTLEAGGTQFEKLLSEVTATINQSFIDERAYAREIKDYNALAQLYDDSELQDAGRMAALRYLFESSGTNVKGFSMSRAPGEIGYGFSAVGGGDGGVLNLLCQILPEYLEKGGRSVGVLKFSPYSTNMIDKPATCTELRTESLATRKL